MGDIHGCIETFLRLLHKNIRLSKQDQLFLLGDYVNRGPDSEAVIDHILELQADGYQVHPLRGNHEEMYLDSFRKRIPARRLEFLNALPFYYETEGFFLVHACLNFYAEDPLADTESMIWRSEIIKHPPGDFLGDRKMVHGHKVHSLSEIQEAVAGDAPTIPLDNGCYKGIGGSKSGIGHLVALELDTMSLIVQDNVDTYSGRENDWLEEEE